MLAFGPLVAKDTIGFAFGVIDGPKMCFSTHFSSLTFDILAFGSLVTRDMTDFEFGAIDDPKMCF